MVCRFWKCLDVSIITPRWLNRGLSSIVISETLNCTNNMIDHACIGVLLYSFLSYKWTETVTFPSSDLKTSWLNVSRPAWVKPQGHSIYVKQWPCSPFNAPKTEFADSCPVEVVRESTMQIFKGGWFWQAKSNIFDAYKIHQYPVPTFHQYWK